MEPPNGWMAGAISTKLSTESAVPRRLPPPPPLRNRWRGADCGWCANPQARQPPNDRHRTGVSLGASVILSLARQKLCETRDNARARRGGWVLSVVDWHPSPRGVHHLGLCSCGPSVRLPWGRSVSPTSRDGGGRIRRRGAVIEAPTLHLESRAPGLRRTGRTRARTSNCCGEGT